MNDQENLLIRRTKRLREALEAIAKRPNPTLEGNRAIAQDALKADDKAQRRKRPAKGSLDKGDRE